jgi:hypothetical protein
MRNDFAARRDGPEPQATMIDSDLTSRQAAMRKYRWEA